LLASVDAFCETYVTADPTPQIIGVLRKQKVGSPNDGCVLSAWGQRAGLQQIECEIRRQDVSDAQKLKAFEDENRQLKKLLVESMLDVSALKDLPGKNGALRRSAAACLPATRHPART